MTNHDDYLNSEAPALTEEQSFHNDPGGEGSALDRHFEQKDVSADVNGAPELADAGGPPADSYPMQPVRAAAGEILPPVTQDETSAAEVAADHAKPFATPIDVDQSGAPVAEYDDAERGDESVGAASPTEYVAAYMAGLGLQVGYDGSLTQLGKPSKAHDRAGINAVLAVRSLTLADLLDLMVIDCKEKRNGIKPGELRAALRHYISEQKHARRNAIVAPLLQEPSLDEMTAAKTEWRRLDSLFEPIPEFRPSVAIMHFMWQVKTKVLGRDVDHHLMPVITSSMQGSGKTTFVRSLLAPLHELVTGASLLSDFGDRRTLGLFRYLVGLIDDMEAVSENEARVLKGIITGDDIHRRMMGTSMDAKVRQMCTLIGTSNSPIEHLVPDDTGHRRFVTLLFRNGAVAKGGDPDIWKTVKSLDYDLMWRSIDPFEPSPLSGHLVALTHYQNAAAMPSVLLQFLLKLDLAHQDVRTIAYRNIGVQAQGLHDLYEARTGKQLTKHAFAKEMFICMKNPKVPFGDKHRYGAMRVYRYRATSPDIDPAASGMPPSGASPQAPVSAPSTPSSAVAASASSAPPTYPPSAAHPTSSTPSASSAPSASSTPSTSSPPSTSPTSSTGSTSSAPALVP
jgi:Virulence-associated protein E